MNRPKLTQRITFRTTDELAEDLVAAAERRGTSVGEVINSELEIGLGLKLLHRVGYHTLRGFIEKYQPELVGHSERT